MGALVAGTINGRKLGIDVQTKTKVFETGADGRVSGVVVEDRTLPADVVVLGLGVKPNVSLARDAGMREIGPTGGIATGAGRRAGPACGARAATAWSVITAATGRSRCARHLREQAGALSPGSTRPVAAEFGGVLGTAVTKICDAVARTGLDEKRARPASSSRRPPSSRRTGPATTEDRR